MSIAVTSPAPPAARRLDAGTAIAAMLAFAAGSAHPQSAADRGATAAVPIGEAFRIDRFEVSVARFDAFLKATGGRSTAEREGGGFE